jgi:hypothetical protein
MKIREVRAMRGPNYWSIRRHKLIVMKLELEELEDFPTNKIEWHLLIARQNVAYSIIRNLYPSILFQRVSKESIVTS